MMWLDRSYLILKLVCTDYICVKSAQEVSKPALTSTDWQHLKFLSDKALFLSYMINILEVTFPFIITVISAALRQKRGSLLKRDRTSDQFEDHSIKEQSIHNTQKSLLFTSTAPYMSPCRELCSSKTRNQTLPFIYCFQSCS